MFDEIFDRTYQAGRAELNSGLGLLFRDVMAAAGNAFRVLHRIEFDSPWLARRRKRRSA